MNRKIAKFSLVNAGLTAVYVILVATFMSHAKDIFGPAEPQTALIPAVMLLLFVVSAAITGFLVFGRPVMWYLDGKKSEALSLLTYTIVVLIIIALVLIAIV